MSPRNLILTSLLVVLASAAWTAPVEDAEEADLTEEAENDLSEENEGDDDSAKKEGHPGADQSAAGSSGDRAAAGTSGGTTDTSADYDSRSNADEQRQTNGRGEAYGTATGVSHAVFLSGGQMSFQGGASQAEYKGTEETPEHRFPFRPPGEDSLTEPDVFGRAEGGETASEPSPSTAVPESARRDTPLSSSPSSQQASRDRSQENGNGRPTQPPDKDGASAGPYPLDAVRLQPTAASIRPNGPTPPHAVADLSASTPEMTRRSVYGTEKLALMPGRLVVGAPALTATADTPTWGAETVTVAADSLLSEPTGTSLNPSGGPASREPPEAGLARRRPDLSSAGGFSPAYGSRSQGPEAAENGDADDTC
ncbi:polycystic kidney disease protein 1-like 3 isoform X2 [Corythoichthys intestinalis]|uniref:polycystic kidney disease protein 1-like 3 isoform X2 n=1 Tax=Corythoichthys intestinalis TaxID=161448 RepID=UPI0025A5AF0D|nr:polycystic kidney disease protein 1-like 3 isoform X2 [Corythoichthys intestinalis]